MDNNEQEVLADDLEQEEDVELDVLEDDVDDAEDEDAEEEVDLAEENAQLKKDIADRDAKLKNKRIKERKAKQKEPVKQDTTLSNKDLLALAKADVDTDDMDEVIEFAQYKKIDVATALKNTTLQAIIKERVEERTTADATSVKAPKRGSAQTSTDTLMSNADKGVLPESDADMMRLVEAQRGLNKKS